MKKLSVKIIFAMGMVWMAVTGISYAGPDILIDEPLFLFDNVTQGTQIIHDFIIKNPGDDVLSILKVVSSCGCTVFDYPETVAPGGTGMINVSIDTSGYGGKIFKRYLIVKTNAPGKESLTLQIKGSVK